MVINIENSFSSCCASPVLLGTWPNSRQLSLQESSLINFPSQPFLCHYFGVHNFLPIHILRGSYVNAFLFSQIDSTDTKQKKQNKPGVKKKDAIPANQPVYQPVYQPADQPANRSANQPANQVSGMGSWHLKMW